MLRTSSERRGPLSRLTHDGWGERLGLAERERDDGPPLEWIIAGVVVVGLGVLAWSYLGPDLKRYLKIQSM